MMNFTLIIIPDKKKSQHDRLQNKKNKLGRNRKPFLTFLPRETTFPTLKAKPYSVLNLWLDS